MKVVFLENVPNVARAGEVKEVAEGYGRNFLLPRKLAAVATPAVLKQLEEQRQAQSRRESRLEAQAEQLAQRLDGATLTIGARVGSQGRLYGSITKAHIAEELQKLTGHAFDRRRVTVEEDPIRHVGSYPVQVHLAGDVTATVTVVVQAEGAPAPESGALRQAQDGA
ncbi:MAG: 50S ribosomal protein L9 [Chloroflexi bacterium]|nr:50S ribosomal protein L9 [Chloroflexota bacterium]